MERWKNKIEQGRKRLPRGVTYRSAGSAWRVLLAVLLVVVLCFFGGLLLLDTNSPRQPIGLFCFYFMLPILAWMTFQLLAAKVELNDEALELFYGPKLICRSSYGSIDQVSFHIPKSKGVDGPAQITFVVPGRHIQVMLSQGYYANAKPFALEALLRVVEANPNLVVEPEILRWLGLSAAEFAKLLDAEPV